MVDAWILKKIDDTDLVQQLIAVKMSIGLEWPGDFSNKVFNVVNVAGQEIADLRDEVKTLRNALDAYREVSALRPGESPF